MIMIILLIKLRWPSKRKNKLRERYYIIDDNEAGPTPKNGEMMNNKRDIESGVDGGVVGFPLESVCPTEEYSTRFSATESCTL